jgi:class 3 adenylate cyclase/TolB-like protein
MGEMKHRYVAVLAADVARYSRFMEDDSEATVGALKHCRKVFRSCVGCHDGREFGTVGDSLMAEFPSAIEALRAARACQKEFAGLEPVSRGGEHLCLRIGLDAGDVIDDGENIFGDAVNTAARLQQIAKPGGIVLSAFVYQQVRKEPGVSFRSLGRQQLRNIREPVRVYEVDETLRAHNSHLLQLAMLRYVRTLAAAAGALLVGFLFIAYFEIRERPGIVGTIVVPAPVLDAKGIGILPFANLSADGGEAVLLSVGIYEDLLANLAKSADLHVILWPTMRKYEGSDESLTAIASELGVANILTGSVLQSGEKVRINLHLVRIPGETHVWAETYDLDLTAAELLAMQTDVVRDIVSELQATFRGQQVIDAPHSPTHGIDAYKPYSKGR